MHMDLVRWKRLAVDGRRNGSRDAVKLASGGMPVLRKEYLGGPSETLGERQLKFTISTGMVDRALDTIDQDGWDLSGYRRNPVVLFQHDSWSFPIGKCVEIGLEGEALRATVEFVRADMPSGVGELADTVLMMCKEGYLSATSVGFRPLEYEVTSDPARGADDWMPGFDFVKQDLTEFSIVTVPCNTEAVIDPAHREDAANPMAALRGIVASAPASAMRSKVLRRLRLDSRFSA